MCGIVGYVGAWNAAPVLLSGLSRLEYRGYDSAGVALCVNDEIRAMIPPVLRFLTCGTARTGSRFLRQKAGSRR